MLFVSEVISVEPLSAVEVQLVKDNTDWLNKDIEAKRANTKVWIFFIVEILIKLLLF